MFCAGALIAAGVALTTDTSHELLRKSVSSVVFGVALVSVLMEGLLILLRFLNIGVLNYKIRWFLLAVSRLCGGDALVW